MAFAIDDRMQVEKLLADRLDVAFHISLPEYPMLRENAKINMRELATGEIVMSVRSWMLDGHKVPREEYEDIEFPATPWEFWKLRHAPKWFLRRFPVKMTKTRVTTAIHHHFVCPHLHTPGDKIGPHVYWMMQKTYPNGAMTPFGDED